MSDDTATAHHLWDSHWQTDEGRADWMVPDPAVEQTARLAAARGGRRALDLGCGVGRHALFLAKIGFTVSAMDGSDTGIGFLTEQARATGRQIDAQVGLMTDLPYPDGTFDFVLAWNVIYHGDRSIVLRAIAEIRRVLMPGGLYQGTMLSKRNENYGQGREVAPETFVLDGVTDKAHPHFYCNAAELMALFQGFELWSLDDREHRRPGSYHWQMVAERL